MIGPIQPIRPRATAGATSRPTSDPASNDDVEKGQATLLRQQAAFNYQVQERAELLREFNELRALQMEQLKHDDEIVKKWIDLI
ncbi:MAG: hypothetical protein JO193_08200 [Candidatus Eremiobacteraeota bacterium]|nr:hypothetical protein [Candidatus Eremiobacteraeota bacterium]